MYFSIKHKLLYYELKLAIHTFNFLFGIVQRYNLSTFIIGKKNLISKAFWLFFSRFQFQNMGKPLNREIIKSKQTKKPWRKY